MGCDIHLFVERYEGRYLWEALDPPAEFQSELFGEYDCEEFYWRIECGYGLFTQLAGVKRNQRFRKDLPVISPPRGVSSDASSVYRKVLADWGPDGYDHSWLTLRELLEHSWDCCCPNELISAMLKLAANANEVRIAFFFDN